VRRDNRGAKPLRLLTRGRGASSVRWSTEARVGQRLGLHHPVAGKRRVALRKRRGLWWGMDGSFRTVARTLSRRTRIARPD